MWDVLGILNTVREEEDDGGTLAVAPTQSQSSIWSSIVGAGKAALEGAGTATALFTALNSITELATETEETHYMVENMLPARVR